MPLHFTAFHPDHKMTDLHATPGTTLERARGIAHRAGLRYVYTGNVRDIDGGTTYCAGCRKPLIVRDWHAILNYAVTPDGRCSQCATPVPGRFGQFEGQTGLRRVPVRVNMARA